MSRCSTPSPARARARASLLGLGAALALVPAPALALASLPDVVAPVRYEGHRVLRVTPSDGAQLRRLLQLADDVWTERPSLGRPVDVRVSPATLAVLDAEGFDYEVRVPDVGAAVDAERARLQASAVEPLAAPSEWFSEFRDWDAIEARMDELAAQQPDLVTVEPVGPSIEGREIRALRLLSPATTDKAAMLVSGTQHAREWLSPMSVMCVAEAMVEGYGTDPATTALLDAVELLLVPVVNPDGYVYSWQAERYWRKNRRGDYGVDLNRNWSHAWGGEGASNYPYDENFRGDGPLSEPETSALAELVEAQPHLVAHVDVHAFGELVLHPWGHQYGPAPDEAMLSALAGQMAGAIEATHGHAYLPIQGSDLYVASGVLDDWSYGQRGMMAFTIELRGNDFVVPPAEIVPACEETLAAVWVLAQWASEQSEPLPVPGDDTTGGGSSSDGTSGEGPLPGDTSPPGEGSTTGVPDGTTGGPGDASTGSPPGGADPEPASGCGCGQRAPAGGGAWLLALLGLGLRRRRLEGERVRGDQ